MPLLPQDLVERPRFGPSDTPSLPHVLLVVDGGDVPPGNPVVTGDGVLGVTVLDLPEQWGELTSPRRCASRSAPRSRRARAPAPTRSRSSPSPAATAHGVADQLSTIRAEAAARRLAPRYTADEPEARDALSQSTELVDLLGIGDVRDFEAESAWRPRLQRDRLRVPIGVDESGAVVALDIKESAQQGMGPHGLVIGATGSGKSELLRTLVLALAMTHSPEALNFVLVDFKGGATFAGMADMPHVSAVITNLGQELTLVERMQDALQGEMTRRQELLRSAGNFANVTDYERARAQGADLEPLPALLIVADEFSELLSAKPEFADLFVAIGRLGRSLSMHLLLSSQRLEEGRLRGLESHLSYRIGLRTFSAGESRTVIGVPDAYELPPVPGLGYLKPDQTTLLKFKAAYVSGPPKGRRRRVDRGRRPGGQRRRDHAVHPRAGRRRTRADERGAAAGPGSEPEETRAVFDIAVVADERQGPSGAPGLAAARSTCRTRWTSSSATSRPTPSSGLVSKRWRERGQYVFPVGIVDRPLEQRRELFVLRLGGAAGHVAVVGGPRTGRSTMARTIVTAIALTTTPLESQFYVLDFGGGTFTPLAKLAHVAGVANRSEPEVVRRLVSEIRGIVDARESYFRANGIDSIETYRSRRAKGLVDDGYGDVFLVVDGWLTLRQEFDDLEQSIMELAGRGLTFGVHVVVTTSRWMDFRNQIRDVLGTRVELRLGDPSDSEVDRRVAANVPKGRPGRGLTMTKHHFLSGIPRVDDRGSVDDLGDGVEDLVDQGQRGVDRPARPEAAPAAGPDHLRRHPRARPAPTRSGSSSASTRATSRRSGSTSPRSRTPTSSATPTAASRRSCAGTPTRSRASTRPTRPSSSSSTTAGRCSASSPTSTSASTSRPRTRRPARSRGSPSSSARASPGPTSPPSSCAPARGGRAPRSSSSSTTTTSSSPRPGSPLRPLVPLLAQAGDVGLHVVLTRRMGGASRALFEPVLQSIRDLGSPGILLSGNPDEGMLIGRAKPSVQPPGRARIISRELGDQVLQLGWQPPRLG